MGFDAICVMGGSMDSPNLSPLANWTGPKQSDGRGGLIFAACQLEPTLGRALVWSPTH